MPVPNSSEAGEIEQPLDEAVEVPEQTTDEVSANEEPQKEQTFTRADVEAMLAEQESKLMRVVQSQVAKSENRTNQRIQDRLAALDANRGVLKLSDADYAAAQEAIVREEQMNALKPQGPQGKQTPQPAPDLEEQARFVIDQIDAVVRAAGVEITPADAEYKLIEAAMSDPNGSLAATIIAADTAAKNKAARLRALKGNAGARAGVGGGQSSNVSSISHINDSATLYELGDKKIRERRR